MTGANFVSGATVRWNGSSRTTTFVSATQLTAAIPAADIAAAGTAQVTVVNPDGGLSPALPFTTAAAPTLTSLSPSAAPAGGPAFTLTVTGANFASGATVRWNGSSRTTTFVSATQLTAAITAADIAGAGSAQVTVVNPGGSLSNALPFDDHRGPDADLAVAQRSARRGAGVHPDRDGRELRQWRDGALEWHEPDDDVRQRHPATAVIPAADIAAAGTAQVTVVNPDGGLSPALPFTTNAASTVVLSTASATGVNADNGTVALLRARKREMHYWSSRTGTTGRPRWTC